MDHSHLAEITVAYKTKVKARDRPRISSSKDAHAIFSKLFNKDTIELLESFYLLLLNKANAVLGYRHISSGGLSGTVVDVRHIFAIALKANAAGIIMGHNHPSGNLQPSQADIDLTRKTRDAGKILDVPLLDHIILSPDETYYSFADEGTI